MTREIKKGNSRVLKFRAWTGNRMIDFKEIMEADYSPWNSTSLEWMQFTGLHDKNGKEIYENDLVKHSAYNEPVEVKWLNVGWTPFMSYHNGEDYEIVGNVCEGLA